MLEGHWLRRKHFTPQLLRQIADLIKQGERDHTGELMIAVEAVSPAHERKSHLRALEVFGRLKVWDTPHNTGVLLYLALDRHHIELIADRGVGVPNAMWERVCAQLQSRLQKGEYVAGVLAAVDDIEAILREHCPPLAKGELPTNDLPDEPVML
ncbi:TPM domain-containing protein [Paralcaligenes sp. KSB-10]|uniref:TPM domain-containing protein n=1 Tax=Paralcaligenes sp. KSB-10 TaxID=2901142 RepID=UPI001E64DB1B|nr:TPM domain-containing protein [Paralcaligenes sp. KSB-10]UHL63382.1 TPM domain-containing protein [Paralcaligenes sp. KSB-10]